MWSIAQGQIDVTMGGVGTVVARINPLNDTLSFTTVPGLAAPDGIANAPNGDVTVINLGTGTAERVTLDGCTSFQSVPFGSTALGYDAQGNLFVVNSFTDSITEYGTNGQIIGTLHDDLLDPGFIAFDPADSDPNAVPEPSTWGLVLLGLGVIGWRLRRKRAFATAKAR
ncbi:MAG: PEP-CTERM sorting domain-containing protein [Verrucomicrobiota bacterium]